MAAGGPRARGRARPEASGARTSKTTRIYQALRHEILAMLLPPGTILVESALAARFAVSKTPLREALALLQQDQLVESLPRKGYLVTMVTVDDQRELIELRAALDGAAAELAARRITLQDIEALQRLAMPLQPPLQPPFDAKAAKRLMERNRRFHVGIARASGNRRLTQLVERLVDETARLFTPGFHVGEHDQIIEALRSGDGARARAAAVNHILMTQDRARKREATGFSLTEPSVAAGS
jgi:GntR family transcriptional regulator, rspAB operon transcriptional repressor